MTPLLKMICCILHGGIVTVLKEVMPGAQHRDCVLHIWKKFIKHWKDKELQGVVWECAKCTIEVGFKSRM